MRRWRKEAGANEWGKPLEAEKDKEADSPQCLREEPAPGTPGPEPREAPCRLQPLEVLDDKHVLFRLLSLC